MDRESLTYNGKTFEKGDNVKFSTKKEGKLIKIGKKVIIVLRGDTLVTLDWIPQSFVQSVIPVSSLLIIISEFLFYKEAYEQTIKD